MIEEDVALNNYSDHVTFKCYNREPVPAALPQGDDQVITAPPPCMLKRES